MPAFSRAISASVPPSNCTWSRLIEATHETSGVMMFVASSRPPSPTSMTARSTAWSAYQHSAIAVIISKKVGCPCFGVITASAPASRPMISVNAANGIIDPLIWIRSRTSTRCGLVYTPTA